MADGKNTKLFFWCTYNILLDHDSSAETRLLWKATLETSGISFIHCPLVRPMIDNIEFNPLGDVQFYQPSSYGMHFWGLDIAIDLNSYRKLSVRLWLSLAEDFLKYPARNPVYFLPRITTARYIAQILILTLGNGLLYLWH